MELPWTLGGVCISISLGDMLAIPSFARLPLSHLLLGWLGGLLLLGRSCESSCIAGLTMVV